MVLFMCMQEGNFFYNFLGHYGPGVPTHFDMVFVLIIFSIASNSPGNLPWGRVANLVGSQ